MLAAALIIHKFSHDWKWKYCSFQP